MQALHRLLIAFGTGLLIDLVVISVEDLDCAEILGLPRRLDLRRLALLDRFLSGRPLPGKGKRWGRCGAWSDAVICPAFDAAGRRRDDRQQLAGHWQARSSTRP